MDCMQQLKRIISISLVASVLLLISIAESPAKIGVQPAYVMLNLEKGRPAGRFVVTNYGESEERYRIHAKHFNFSKTGGLQLISPDKNSLAPWVKFNPKEFNLPPKSKRTIRYVIVPKKKLKKGHYWAAMELESLQTRKISRKDDKGRQFNLQVIPSILVPIFGTFGKVDHRGTLEGVQLIKDKAGVATIRALVRNTGTGTLPIRGKYEILDRAGEQVAEGPIGFGYILPFSDRSFSSRIQKDLQETQYTVKVEYTSKHLKEPLKSEVKIVWKATTQAKL